MPALNDLTPEEEAMFAEHGVPSAGPGREPLADDQGQQGQQEEAAQEGEAGQQGQQDQRPRRPDGTFMSREEIAARQAEQGQQGGEEDGSQGVEPKMVPHAALHQERLARARLAQQLQVATTRMNQILSSREQQGGSQTPQMPDINEDPAGYIVALEQRMRQFEEAQGQERETRQLDSQLENDEAVFSQQRPDYQAASDHYVASRAQELLQFYPPQQAQQILLNEARTIARESWQRGMSAAETIYNLAQARGYNPNTPQRQPTPRSNQNGKPNAQDVVAGVRNGQQASRSLSGGAGAGRAAVLNAEAILNMTDEEFEQSLGLGTKGANSRFAAIGG